MSSNVVFLLNINCEKRKREIGEKTCQNLLPQLVPKIPRKKAAQWSMMQQFLVGNSGKMLISKKCSFKNRCDAYFYAKIKLFFSLSLCLEFPSFRRMLCKHFFVSLFKSTIMTENSECKMLCRIICRDKWNKTKPKRSPREYDAFAVLFVVASQQTMLCALNLSNEKQTFALRNDNSIVSVSGVFHSWDWLAFA